MVSFTSKEITNMLIAWGCLSLFGFWWAIPVYFVIGYLMMPKSDNSPERQEIIRLEKENEKLMAPLVDNNTVKYMEYIMNDPDLELFKARCRARGEVF